jgi:deoxycytidylate deaminase
MDAGDALRKVWDVANGNRNRGDAGAFVAMVDIIRWRAQINSGMDSTTPGLEPLDSHAFLIDSIKHPDELDRLRRTYGPAFVSIGVFAPRESRREALEAELHPNEDVDFVERLMGRDEDDVPLGQHVADAFYLTDFIVDVTRDPKEIRSALRRLIELLLGNVLITPEPDEYGMFLARAAQVRSSSLARQIGAAVLRNDGTVVSLGTNEVPKPIVGGQYWPADDVREGRDKDYKMSGSQDVVDTSDWWRQRMLSDVIEKLNSAGLFGERFKDNSADDRYASLVYDHDGILRKTLIRQDIDYIRAVHAEAAAIVDAGRHNISLLETTMYATTFPCHECARHIVAAGVAEVVYLEPYPKSGVRVLFNDSISVDPLEKERSVPPQERKRVVFRTFVGVAPPRYLEFFSLGSRPRKQKGKPIPFFIKKSPPELPYYAPSLDAIKSSEGTQTDQFLTFVSEQENKSHDRPPSQPERDTGSNKISDGKRAGLDVRGRKKARKRR